MQKLNPSALIKIGIRHAHPVTDPRSTDDMVRTCTRPSFCTGQVQGAIVSMLGGGIGNMLVSQGGNPTCPHLGTVFVRDSGTNRLTEAPEHVQLVYRAQQKASVGRASGPGGSSFSVSKLALSEIPAKKKSTPRKSPMKKAAAVKKPSPAKQSAAKKPAKKK